MKYLKIFNPIIVFAVTWLSVIVLFSFRLSKLLEQSTNEAWFFYAISLGPFIIGYLITLLLRKKIDTKIEILTVIDEVFYRRFFIYFFWWILLTVVEVIYSKGFPFLWILTGSDKTYFDYGIPSIHGLMNALELSLGIIAFYFYKLTKKRNFLVITIFFVIWNIMLVTRQVIIVLLIEIFVINFFMADNKLRLMKNMLLYVFLGVLGFGILGDFRSGGEAFVQLAQPTDNWPTFLPSGFLWVYIYVTTPLNNLLYNFSFPITDPHVFFPYTLSLLLPSVLRNLVFDPDSFTVVGNLVSQAFNVSSAFTAPYTDMGFLGIVIFSFFAGVFSNLVWWVKGTKKIFFHAIIIQIIILSIFYNMFMYLPVVFQFVWISIYFYKGNNTNQQNA